MSSASPTAPPKRIFPKTTGLTALWRHRRTLRVLVQRDLAVKYQSSVLGYLWSLIEPLGLALIYWFIFGVLYDKGGLDKDVNYGLYIVAGIFAWQWANSAMSEATTSLTGQSQIITTMKVPREVFPVARVFARFAEFLAGVPIIIGFAIFGGGGAFTWNILFLFAAILLQAMLLTGLSFILASLNVLYRDVQRFMRLVMRMMFYSTPVIYPLEMVIDRVPGWALTIYQLNPFVGIIELHHSAWIPAVDNLSWQLVAPSIVMSVVLLFMGRWMFHKLEPSVLKEL